MEYDLLFSELEFVVFVFHSEADFHSQLAFSLTWMRPGSESKAVAGWVMGLK